MKKCEEEIIITISKSKRNNKKINIDKYLSSYTKINSKWIKGFNIITKLEIL